MSTLARLTANTLMKEKTSQDDIVRIATEYQLMCEHTAYLVIDVRSEELKTDGMPELRKVPTMLASGWGGLGQGSLSLVAACEKMHSYSMLDEPFADRRMGNGHREIRFDDQKSQDLDYLDIPAFLRRQADAPDDFISPDSLWKCQDSVEINRIVNARSLADLQKFGIPESVLDQLKEIKESLPKKVSEHQLIIAFFYLKMISPSNELYTDETRRIVKSAFEKEMIDDGVVLRIKDLLIEMDETKPESECPE